MNTGADIGVGRGPSGPHFVLQSISHALKERNIEKKGKKRKKKKKKGKIDKRR